MALTKANIEAIWLQQLLSDLGFTQYNSTTIFVDYKSAIALAKKS